LKQEAAAVSFQFPVSSFRLRLKFAASGKPERSADFAKVARPGWLG